MGTGHTVVSSILAEQRETSGRRKLRDFMREHDRAARSTTRARALRLSAGGRVDLCGDHRWRKESSRRRSRLWRSMDVILVRAQHGRRRGATAYAGAHHEQVAG